MDSFVRLMCKTVIFVPGVRFSYVVARGILWFQRVDTSATFVRSSFGRYEMIVRKSGSNKFIKFVMVVVVTMVAVVGVLPILVAVLLFQWRRRRRRRRGEERSYYQFYHQQ